MLFYYTYCVAATNNVHTMGRGKKTDAGSLPIFINMLFV